MPGSRSLATSPACGATSREAIPCGNRAGAGGEPRLHPFREEGPDHAGEDVAGAGGRERRRPVGGDEHALARRGDERVGAFEEHRGPEARSGPPYRLEAMRVDLLGLGSEKACELARVRRHHRRAPPARTARAPTARRRRGRPAPGAPRAGARTRSRVPSLRPRPGPSTTACARSAASSTASAARGSSRPEPSSGSPRLTASRRRDSSTGATTPARPR